MKSFIPYVNIKMGTGSVQRFSCGNTLPLVQRPFGMASFAPQTDGRTPWFYQPEHPIVEGIRLTHQPSPWINDYGTFLMVPQNDVISDTAAGAWTGFDRGTEVLRPDRLRMDFLRQRCSFELTPTERGAAIRLRFADDRRRFLSFLPVKGNYTYRFDAASETLFGSTDGHSGDDSVGFRMYFAVRFEKGTTDAADTRINGENNTAAAHIALCKKSVEARIGISYIDEETALAVIDRECGCRTFDALCTEAEEVWEEHLHRIEIKADEKTEKTFYSCLYRTFLFPHKAYEIARDGSAVHYSPCDGKTRSGVRYTDNGFWDTSRTVYPLFAKIARNEFAEMLEGFVNDYLECGWLPRWLSIGEVGCMPSTLIDGVIAEAAVQGIGSREVLENALNGMLHHANFEAEKHCYGRNGAKDYLKYGYVCRDTERQSVNLTLDAAYGDFCIATVAKVLGHDELIDLYTKRSKNYRNLFDPATGFMRGRDHNGKMAEDFDPTMWGGEYTEGSAWQNSFFVPHDVEGLAALYGGKEPFLKKMDELFATPPTYRTFLGGYGGEIHEMTEMGTADFGQCAISNQPSFHLPFFYAALGETEKTDYWVHRICREAFSPDEYGFPGDEDNGTMAAWYVFCCIGEYPLCPGDARRVKFRRFAEKVTILGKEV